MSFTKQPWITDWPWGNGEIFNLPSGPKYYFKIVAWISASTAVFTLLKNPIKNSYPRLYPPAITRARGGSKQGLPIGIATRVPGTL